MTPNKDQIDTIIARVNEWADVYEEYKAAEAAYIAANRKMNDLKESQDKCLYWVRSHLNTVDPDQTRVWPFALSDGKVAYVTMTGDKSTVLNPIK